MRPVLVALGVLVVVVIVAASAFDWNRARGVVERQVTATTGRSFTIKGDLDVNLSLTPRVRIEKVALGNAAWGSRDSMLSADAIDFRISLLPLLWGHLVLPEVHLERPDLLLEKNAEGAPNWELAPAGAQPGKPPSIGSLAVDNGEVRYRDPVQRTDVVLNLETSADTKQDDGELMMRVRGDGVYRGSKLEITGRAGSLLSLRKGRKPYPFNLKGHVGPTKIEAHGTIAEPVIFNGVDFMLELAGPNLAKFGDLIVVPMPVTPPYHLRGRLLREGKSWRVEGLSGDVGDSDLAGDFNVDLRGERPLAKANLRSRYLDIDDLAGVVGAPPQTGPGETASPAQKRQAARKAKRAEVLPDREFNLDRLRSVDFDVELRGERVKSPKLPLDHLHVHAVLNKGRLELRPLDFGVAGGDIASTLTFNVNTDPMTMQGDVTLKTIRLSRLFPNAKLPEVGSGRFGGTARLQGSGNSIAKLAARLDGDIGIAMSGGEISKLLVELAGIDIGEAALQFFLGKEKEIPIRCAVGDFGVQQGRMAVKTLVLDTTDTKFVGEGSIDLGAEALNLKIHAQPKDESILSARAPLEITGSFKKPDLEVAKGKVVAKGAAAAALGAALGPLAALVPLVETGPGESANCRALIMQAGPGEGQKQQQDGH